MRRIIGILLLLALANVVCAETAPRVEWDTTFGGAGDGRAYSVQQTTDGGYILAGYTSSYCAGSNDFWLVKTDPDGKKEWSKTFGGAGDDEVWSVQQTTDGGYILAGYTSSYCAGPDDFWLVKTDPDGNAEWSKTFGGTGEDWALSVRQTTDGGYILAGATKSYGAGDDDFWLVKTDSDGKKEWDKTFGGTDEDVARSVQQTTDDGYILTGYTSSYGAGDDDFWLVKVRSPEQEALSAISEAKSAITSTSKIGADTTSAHNLLDQAQNAFSNFQYQSAIDYSIEKKKSADSATELMIEAQSAVSKAEPAIASANQIGADTTEAQSLLGRAETALSDGEYQSAISYATQAEASAKKSRTEQLGIYAAPILIAILIIAISLKATANVRERRRTVEAERRRKEEEENHRREEAKQKILDKIEEVI